MMTHEQINIDLFDQVKKLQRELIELQADKERLDYMLDAYFGGEMNRADIDNAMGWRQRIAR